MNYLVLAVLCIGAVKAHTPEVVSVAWAGKFPQFSFVSDFNVDDFKGKWYSIRATGSRDPGCVYYDLKVPETNQYTAFVYPKNYTMEFNKKNVDTFDEGFSVSSKFNPFVDGGELKVLLTDYKNYALIYVAKQPSEYFHYQNYLYWSREPFLSSEYIYILDEFLYKKNIDLSFLYWVKQKGCTYE